MPKKKTLSPVAEGLRQRIQQLVDKHSLSEIARRTGAGFSNVHRYLAGTRVPAEFCAELVKQFGVTPSWLLNGEGSPQISDVTAGTSKMAGDVLELVEAMNSVSQMRLGALTGKHHLRVLRELNTALTRYEELRTKLNSHSAPIFADLLDKIRRSIAARDHDHTFDLLKAASQVERLCDDPALSRRLTRLRSHIASLEMDLDAAVRHQQKLMYEPVAEGRFVSPEQCDDALRLAMILHSQGRVGDSLRLHRAVAELADDEARRWPEYADLRFFEGAALARFGRLSEGMTLMQKWRPRMTPKRSRTTRGLMNKFMLLSDMVTPEEALVVAGDDASKYLSLIEVAYWLEDVKFLAVIMERLTGRENSGFGGDAWDVEAVGHFLRVLQNRDPQSVANLRRAAEEHRPAQLKTPSRLDARCAHFALVLGDRKEAARWQERARKYHAKADVHENLNVVSRALFLRNELRLDPKSKEAEAAREELQGYVDNGYWLLRSALIE